MISQHNYLFIGTTQHTSDRSINHQVYTDLKFIGKLQLVTVQLRLNYYEIEML